MLSAPASRDATRRDATGPRASGQSRGESQSNHQQFSSLPAEIGRRPFLQVRDLRLGLARTVLPTTLDGKSVSEATDSVSSAGRKTSARSTINNSSRCSARTHLPPSSASWAVRPQCTVTSPPVSDDDFAVSGPRFSTREKFDDRIAKRRRSHVTRRMRHTNTT